MLLKFQSHYQGEQTMNKSGQALQSKSLFNNFDC